MKLTSYAKLFFQHKNFSKKQVLVRFEPNTFAVSGVVITSRPIVQEKLGNLNLFYSNLSEISTDFVLQIVNLQKYIILI